MNNNPGVTCNCGGQLTSKVVKTFGYDMVTNTDTQQDPIIRGYSQNIFFNCDNDRVSAHHDMNRLTAKTASTECMSNSGWGLGTDYDNHLGRRPACDAMYYTGVGGHDRTWGGGGGIIGSDCSNKHDCGWCHQSGDSFSYAIFVR